MCIFQVHPILLCDPSGKKRLASKRGFSWRIFKVPFLMSSPHRMDPIGNKQCGFCGLSIGFRIWWYLGVGACTPAHFSKLVILVQSLMWYTTFINAFNHSYLLFKCAHFNLFFFFIFNILNLILCYIYIYIYVHNNYSYISTYSYNAYIHTYI